MATTTPNRRLVASAAAMLCACGAGLLLAATPPSATLSPESPEVTWTGGPLPSTGSASCGGPASSRCDNFALTIAPPTTGGYTVTITLTPTPPDDWDLQVYAPNGNVGGESGNPPALAETVTLNNPAAGTWTVAASPYDVRFSYSARATLLFDDSRPLPTAPPSSERAPTYAAHYPDDGQGTGAAEPTLGVNPKNGTVMYIAGLETLRVRFDDTCSPAAGDWQDVSFLTTSQTTFDPILWTDETLGRTFVSQLLPSKLSLTAYTDDDGESWTPSQGAGINSGVDHQALGGGRFADGVLRPLDPEYPHSVFYCSQDIALAYCAVSLDGGSTFGPAVPIYSLAECGGLHGHPKVDPTTGHVAVPNKDCGEQAVIVSEDNGLTWEIRRIPGSTAGPWDPSVAFASDGTMYVGFNNGDGKPYVAVSRDAGRTWDSIYEVGSQHGIQNVAFAGMVAGDPERAAFAFLGTTATGDAGGDDPNWPGVWHLYVAHTYDRGESWVTVNATPDDPVQRGTICAGGTLGCPRGTRNLLDFIDATIDTEGRVLVAYADGCIGDCVASPPGSFAEVAAIARQTVGKRMFARFDSLGVPSPPRLAATTVDGAVHLAWAQPDDHGAPVQRYDLYRRTAAGGFSLLTTVGADVTSFVDANVDAAETYFYQVTASNAAGTSARCAEVAPVAGADGPDPRAHCAPPGLPVSSDAAGDVSTGGTAQHDLRALGISEAVVGAAHRLVATMQVADLSTLPPNSIWRTEWKAPNGTTYFVNLSTAGSGSGPTLPGQPACNYGAIDAQGIYRSQGLADSCAHAADGSITIGVASSKVGNVLPDAPLAQRGLAGVRADALVLGGALGTGVTTRVDSMPAGTYVVRGTAACTNASPVANDDAAATPQETPVRVDVLANDADADGEALAVAGVTQPARGTAGDNGDGTVTYSPAVGFSGSDAFTYTVRDPAGATDTAAVRVTVSPRTTNNPPVARDDAAATEAGTAVTVDVLANDSDADGHALTVADVTQPAHGSVANGGSAVAYTPAAGFTGSDAFTYIVDDGHGGSASATVTVTVAPAGNHPPVAVDDAATTRPNKPLQIDVLANDSDADGDALVVTAISAAGNGQVVAKANGRVAYKPNKGFTGADRFTYTVSDGRGGSAVASVVIDVR